MKKLEEMTIGDIRIEKENMQYDMETAIKNILKEYKEIVSGVKIWVGNSTHRLTISTDDMETLNVEPIIDIKI